LQPGREPRWRRLLPAAALVALFIPATEVPAAAAAAERPNVMIVISDDQRDDQMKVMRQTRSIFGDGGTELANGYVTTPLCCPSRSTILTGLYVHNHGVYGNHGEDPFPHETSMQRELSRMGYRTGVFGKFINGWPKRVNPPYFNVSRLGYGPKPRLADRVTGAHVRQFLRRGEREDAAPWFAVYAARAPHSPLLPLHKLERAPVPKFEPRPSYLERNLSDKPPLIRELAEFQRHIIKRREPRKHWRGEQRLLLGLDEQLAKTFGTLSRLGEERDTLVFYISDNGYHLGEHRLVRKGSPYRESVEVPFYMRWPGHVPPGVVDDRLAANVDIAPTIYDAAGITPSYPLDGHSLLGGERRRWAFAEHHDFPWHWAQVFDGSSRYIETYTDSGAVSFREFYDLERDPFELQNLFARSESAAADPRVIAATQALREARFCAASDCP